MAKIEIRKLRRQGKSLGGEATGAGADAEANGAQDAATADDGPDHDASGGAAPGGTTGTEGPSSQAPPLGPADGEVEYELSGQAVSEPADETREQRLRRIRLENLAKGRLGRKRKPGGSKGTPARPRPPASEPSKAEDFRLDRAAVKALLDVVDIMAQSQLGPVAKFNAQERALIEPSLSRIMARMTPRSAAIFGTMADPIMLGFGLVLWSTRVFGSRQAGPQRPTLLPTRPAPAPAPPSESVSDTFVPPTVNGYEEGALPAELLDAMQGGS